MPIEIKQPMARDLFFNSQVDQATIGAITKSIIEINRSDDEIQKMYSVFDVEYKRQPIKIYIDSYGGYVYQMFGMVGVIEKSKTPVHTIVTGAAMSAGFIILISGHRRFAYKYARPMYHQISSNPSGKIQDLKEDLQEFEVLQDMAEENTLAKTSIKKSMLKDLRSRKVDLYLSAKESLKHGVIDEIL